MAGLWDTYKESNAASNRELARNFPSPAKDIAGTADSGTPSASIMGGKYFGPRVGSAADNPLVIEDASGGRTSNVLGWAGAGLKKAFGIDGGIAGAAPANAGRGAATIAAVPAASAPAMPVAVPMSAPAALSARSSRKGSSGVIKSGTSVTTDQPSTLNPQQPQGGVVTPGYAVPGETNLTQLPTDQFNASFPDGIAGYNVPKGGGVAQSGDQTVFLRGNTPEEQTVANQQKVADAISQPSTLNPQPPQMTTYGDSTGVYQLAPGQNPPKDFSKMSLGDLAVTKFGLNQQGKQATIANVNSEIARRGDQTAMEAARLPGQIAGDAATARHLNVSTDIAGLKAPVEIKSVEEATKHMAALTQSENSLRDLKAKGMASEIDYRKGMLELGNKKLDILNKQWELRLAAAKQTGSDPDYKLIADIAKNKLKTYTDIRALGGLTPEHKLDMSKQNDILNLVQRHATKSKTVYAGNSTASTTDDDI